MKDNLIAYLANNQVDGIMPVAMQYSGSQPIPPQPHFFWVEDMELLRAVHEGPSEGWIQPSGGEVLAHYQGTTGRHVITIAEAQAAIHIRDNIWELKGIEMELLVYVPVVAGQTPKAMGIIYLTPLCKGSNLRLS